MLVARGGPCRGTVQLAPSSSNTIEVDHNGFQEGAPPAIGRTHFRTASGPTGVPPTRPTLLGSVPRAGSGWLFLTRALELEFEHQGILIGDTGTLGPIGSASDLFIEAASAAEGDDVTPRIEWVTTDSNVWVGKADCTVWPLGAPDRQVARFGVLDLAGNFSGWVETELELPSEAEAEAQVALAEQERAGEEQARGSTGSRRSELCNAAPGVARGSAAWLTLALAGVFGAARRLRRRAAQ